MAQILTAKAQTERAIFRLPRLPVAVLLLRRRRRRAALRRGCSHPRVCIRRGSRSGAWRSAMGNRRGARLNWPRAGGVGVSAGRVRRRIRRHVRLGCAFGRSAGRGAWRGARRPRRLSVSSRHITLLARRAGRGALRARHTLRSGCAAVAASPCASSRSRRLGQCPAPGQQQCSG